MQKKKLLTAIMSLSLVAVVGIGGTLAYLSDKTELVTNTFAVGSGYVGQGIVLDESDVQFNKTERTETVNTQNRKQGNEYPDLLPGDERTKDPTVWMSVGSVESYVFINIEGADILAEDGVTINDFNDGGEWVKVDNRQGIDGIYRYKEIVDVRTVEGKKEGDLVAVDQLFSKVTFSGDTTNEEFAEVKKNGLTDLVIQAAAVQAANIDEAIALTEAMNAAEWKTVK